MTMLPPPLLPLYGSVKRGNDKAFRAIAVRVKGQVQDFTAEGWSVTMQARPFESSPDALTFSLDPEELKLSRIVPSLTSTQTADATLGTWVCDVRVEGPDGIRSSRTMALEVVANVSRPDPEPTP